jgi:hypothetical protein
VILLSHRGHWRDIAEKNSERAFRRAFDAGFGIETDIRDRNASLVVSHDMPGDAAMSVADLLDILGSRNLAMALNVKSDGLARALVAQMRARGLSRWFTFDMSLPEMVTQIRLGMPVFTRVSEYERQPLLYDQSVGVWVDSFVSDWHSAADVETWLRDAKQVAIVSPELHGRPHTGFWRRLRESGLTDNPALMLCTDFPEDAAAFFHGSIG